MTAEVVLLVLFAIGLLVAQLITASRSAVVLSEPIALQHAGLSVSIPTGRGWQGRQQWEYHNNAFNLTSVFSTGSGRVCGLARCRYLLAAEQQQPHKRFEQKALEVDGVIARQQQTYSGDLVVNWAHIEKPKTPLNVFFATIELPGRRQLDIEVQQLTSESKSAESAFMKMLESLSFEDNQLLEAGGEVVARLKETGVAVLLPNKNRQSSFLIVNSLKSTVGFAVDVIINSGSDTEPNIQAASMLYLRGRYAQEQATSFVGADDFRQFDWRSETVSSLGQSGAEMSLDEEGTLSVTSYDKQTAEEFYRLSPAAIPEVFVDLLLEQLLDTGKERIVMDIIEADGKITPTLISRADPPDSDNGDRVRYRLVLEFLSTDGYTLDVHFDEQKQIREKILKQDAIFFFNRASIEEISSQFPERADYLRQRVEP